jgi:hypothetical protein
MTIRPEAQVLNTLIRSRQADTISRAAAVLTELGYQDTAYFLRAIAECQRSGELAPAFRPEQLTRPVAMRPARMLPCSRTLRGTRKREIFVTSRQSEETIA